MADIPYRIDKPWGYELIWAKAERYVGKILHVNAGHTLSCQYHNVKDETLHVLTGELKLLLREQNGPERTVMLTAGDSIHIPPLLIHQMEAVVDSDVLEASTPELDDLVRITDRYGRA